MHARVKPASYNHDFDYDIDTDGFVDEIYEDEVVRDINEDLYADEPSEIFEPDVRDLSSDDEHNAADPASETEEASEEAEPIEDASAAETATEPVPAPAPGPEPAPLSALVPGPAPAPAPEFTAAALPEDATARADLSPLTSAEQDVTASVPAPAAGDAMTALWAKGYSHFIIAKHLGLSTKEVRDRIEELGLSEKQGRLPLPDDHAYWTKKLPEKREFERQMLAADQPGVPTGGALSPARASLKPAKPDLPFAASAPADDGAMAALWAKGYSHFIIAKHLGASTKLVRDRIEELGLSEGQGKLPLSEDHPYWTVPLPEKREIERQLLAAEFP